jgi:RNA-binding protein 39
MSDIDMPDAMKVEALLEEAAKEMEDKTATETHRASQSGDDAPRGGSDNRDRDRDRARRDGRPSDGHRRDRSRERTHRESNNGERHRSRERRRKDGSQSIKDADTDEGDDRTSSRRHDRSRERPRGGRGDRGDRDGRRGDFYSGSGRARSRSPRRDGDRYRAGRDHGRDRSRDRRPRPDDDRRGSGARRNPTPPEEPTEDDRDKRTIFVQQISARAETRHLRQFFESHCGAVVEAQIVKDRVTGRSKGYVLSLLS